MAKKRSSGIDDTLNRDVAAQINGAKLHVISGALTGLTATDVELVSGIIRLLRGRRQAIAVVPEFQNSEAYKAMVKAISRKMAGEELGVRPGTWVEGAQLEALERRAQGHMERFLR